MAQFLLLVVIALVVAAIVFGVAALILGMDPGLTAVVPEGESRGFPDDRPLREQDFADVRFDVVLRGYRMSQVDAALSRAAYDIGYKQELIETLEAEAQALREGRTADAEALRAARLAATTNGRSGVAAPPPAGPDPAGWEPTEPNSARSDFAGPEPAPPTAAEPTTTEPAGGESTAESDTSASTAGQPDSDPESVRKAE